MCTASMKILGGVTVALITATTIFVGLDAIGAINVPPDVVQLLIGFASASSVCYTIGVVGRNIMVRLNRLEQQSHELRPMLAAIINEASESAEIKAAEAKIAEIREGLPTPPNGLPKHPLRSVGP
jgi:hypothetical protein